MSSKPTPRVGENSQSHADAHLIRLNRFIATAGVCSRRKADELIAAGKVRVNDAAVTNLGVKVDPSRDTVFVNGKQVVSLDESVYILFNKPKDCITTAKDERGRTTVLDYVKVRERIFPVGRLDRQTTGVLILTNDGEFANRLMHPRFEVEKTYRVALDRQLSREDADKLSVGIRLSDGKTEPAEVYNLPGAKKSEIAVTIREGRNRQIHRMFEKLGYEVKKLDRVAYAGMTCQGLPRGGWRYLTRAELNKLNAAAGAG